MPEILQTARRGSTISYLAGHPPGTRTVQLQVLKNSTICGKCLAELNLPQDFLVIHIQREGRNFIPHGDTRLEPDDIVTFLVKENEISLLDAFWQKNNQLKD